MGRLKGKPKIPHDTFDDPYRNLAWAMMISAVSEKDAVFINSHWAADICKSLGVDVAQFRSLVKDQPDQCYTTIHTRVPIRIKELAEAIAQQEEIPVSHVWGQALADYIERRASDAESETGVE